MNRTFIRLSAALAGMTAWAGAQTVVSYTNFIRQTQYPSEVIWDVSVTPTGSSLSALAINPGGARFDLWTVRNTPLTNYLLSTAYVGAYVPMGTIAIRSQDPYNTIPRTRADRPFYVDITLSGLLAGEDDPEASKSVLLLRHVQSYGVGGNGINLDRTQATLLSQSTLYQNGSRTLTYALTSIPGADRSKVRGEERFSIFSVEDYQAPSSQISSQFIQVWPVASGSISGIAADAMIRYALPQVTFTLTDLYPESTTYAQVYKGNPVLGTEGTVVPGSVIVVSDSLPQNRTLVVGDYDAVVNSDGRWTMEILTRTTFGLDRLAFVSFNVDRTMIVNGSFTTIE